MTFEYKLPTRLDHWAIKRPSKELHLTKTLVRHSQLQEKYIQGGRKIWVYTLSDQGYTYLALNTHPCDMIRVLKERTTLLELVYLI